MKIAPQHRIYCGFFLFAFAMGSLMSRLADLQLQFGVEEGVLGLTIIGMSIGALISLTFSANFIKQLGQKNTLRLSLFGCATALSLVPLMPGVEAAFVCLFFGGLSIGALEISLNIEADRIEAMTGQRIMSRAHGFWSIGFFVAALASIPIRQAGISPLLHMAAIPPATVFVIYIFYRGFAPAPPRGGFAVDKPPLVARPSRGVLALCAVGLTPVLMEGAGLDWSVIYMRDTFVVAPAISSMSLTVFTLFMAAGRLAADPVISRFGPRDVTLVLLTMCVASLFMVAYAPSATIALAGFALMGLGASAVYPVVVSEAAQLTDRPAEINVAALSQIVFLVFLFGPPLLGFVAQFWGIRAIYLVCLPFAVLSIVFGLRLGKRVAVGPSAGSTPTSS